MIQRLAQTYCHFFLPRRPRRTSVYMLLTGFVGLLAGGCSDLATVEGAAVGKFLNDKSCPHIPIFGSYTIAKPVPSICATRLDDATKAIGRSDVRPDQMGHAELQYANDKDVSITLSAKFHKLGAPHKCIHAVFQEAFRWLGLSVHQEFPLAINTLQ